MSDLVSEDHILARIASHFPNEGPDVLLGRGDDCAVLGVSGPLCVSTDLFMEDVHFRRSYFTPEDIGWKALAVNLSDLAADGARPMGFTVGLSLPPDADMALVDGLCAGIGMIDFAALALIALSLSVLPDGTTDNDLFNTAIFCASLCGALLGFLRFNTHPASVFMGDVGSFAIGGAMVAVAIVTRQMLILPIIAFTMVLASLSDLIQFAYFRISHGKRVFRMAPLQHHFELSGIPETRIVAMYDIVTAMMCLIALSGFVG